MADKNVYITPITPNGHTFYFPGCHVYVHLDKTLTNLPVPKGMISLDLLFSSRTVRVVGTWRDDHLSNDYDGYRAFYRFRLFLLENEESAQVYQFHWSNDGFEEPDLYVKVASIDTDRPPGMKGAIPYNIVFQRITESI